MKNILVLMIAFLGLNSFARPLSLEERIFAHQQVRELKRDIREGDLSALAQRTDQALDAIVAKGVAELEKAGDAKYAATAKKEWAGKYAGYLTRMVDGEWDIGDHKPLVAWLANFYERCEFILGVEACKALHLSDIKTLNFCIPVVFKPCTFPMDAVQGTREDEYRRHFAQGAVYYGLTPVITYWVVNISCDVASHGAGVIWLCGPIASVAEYAMAKFVAPWLSDKVFEAVCK